MEELISNYTFLKYIANAVDIIIVSYVIYKLIILLREPVPFNYLKALWSLLRPCF